MELYLIKIFAHVSYSRCIWILEQISKKNTKKEPKTNFCSIQAKRKKFMMSVSLPKSIIPKKRYHSNIVRVFYSLNFINEYRMPTHTRNLVVQVFMLLVFVIYNIIVNFSWHSLANMRHVKIWTYNETRMGLQNFLNWFLDLFLNFIIDSEFFLLCLNSKYLGENYTTQNLTKMTEGQYSSFVFILFKESLCKTKAMQKKWAWQQ